jgi:mono/diheme cytochrome c family protein
VPAQRRHHLVAFALGGLALGVSVCGLRAQNAPGAPSQGARSGPGLVAAGAQRERGDEVYFSSCVECHNNDLSGGAAHAAPPLVGDAFRSRWKGRSAAELYEQTRLTMPQVQPKSLSDQQYLDVVALILGRNGLIAEDVVLDESLAQRIAFN